MSKTQEEYIKEIAEKINNATKYEIENPTVEDIKKLKDFDYIVTDGVYFPVMIRRRYRIGSVLGVSTTLWYNGYEVGDSVMGMIPETYTAEEALMAVQGFKGEYEDE